MSPSLTPTNDKIRNKSVELIYQALGGKQAPDEATQTSIADKAAMLEQSMFTHNGRELSDSYKNAVRSHVYNLKTPENHLRDRILSGELDAEKFADMTAEEMASPRHAQEVAAIRRSSITQSMGPKDEPQPIVRDEYEAQKTTFGPIDEMALRSGGDADART